MSGRALHGAPTVAAGAVPWLLNGDTQVRTHGKRTKEQVPRALEGEARRSQAVERKEGRLQAGRPRTKGRPEGRPAPAKGRAQGRTPARSAAARFERRGVERSLALSDSSFRLARASRLLFSYGFWARGHCSHRVVAMMNLQIAHGRVTRRGADHARFRPTA